MFLTLANVCNEFKGDLNSALLDLPSLNRLDIVLSREAKDIEADFTCYPYEISTVRPVDLQRVSIYKSELIP